MRKSLEEWDKWPPTKCSGDAFDRTVTFMEAAAKELQEGNVGHQYLGFCQLGGAGMPREIGGQTEAQVAGVEASL